MELDRIEKGVDPGVEKSFAENDLERVKGQGGQERRPWEGEDVAALLGGWLLVVVFLPVERLLLVVDEGDGVNEGEIEPRFEFWVSLFGLRSEENEGKGDGRSARC